MLRTPENSWLQGILINRSSSNASIPTLKPRANNFQSKTYHTNSPATEEHSPELQYTGCPKSHQTHWHLITHYWTLHCTPERRNPIPPTRTQATQASLTRKPWQATRPTPPTVRKLHNKENPTNCQNMESESEVAQSCLTLCDPMDYSLSGFSIDGIFQARVLEWIAISFSRGSSWPRNRTQVSCIAGRHFTVWATREAIEYGKATPNTAI